jgi:holo-[acyl-carrier protein] synthase
MIVGTGIDIAEVPRIRQSIERFGSRFLERIFTESEMHSCDSKANRGERYAARFRAKQAAMKALGTGRNYRVRWRDCEVGRKPGRRPTMHFHGKDGDFAAKLGVKNTSLSISHREQQAIAQVIVHN